MILFEAGRGRGRGGGVPVLPAGMWEALNGSNGNSGSDNLAVDVDAFLSGDNDLNIADSNGDLMPVGFGRSGGRNGGRTGGRGRGRGRDFDERGGRGRGIERDLKGKDWECPSCTNINWSWRTTCNKCNASKPAVRKLC